MSEQQAPSGFGRVDADGTVYVIQGGSERSVGQIPDSTPEEALAFYVRRFENLAAEVTLLMPRVLDVLNSYLRAVDPASFDDPGAMTRLRAQMLRRIQIVTGEGRVRDLLITEFVLN